MDLRLAGAAWVDLNGGTEGVLQEQGCRHMDASGIIELIVTIALIGQAITIYEQHCWARRLVREKDRLQVALGRPQKRANGPLR